MSTLQSPKSAVLSTEPNRRGEVALQAIAEDAPRYTPLFRRVFAGKASPRQAIKATCLRCVWFEMARLKSCTVADCPLHLYRPFQEKRDA